MAQKKYASLSTLSTLVDNIKTLFVKKEDFEAELGTKVDTSVLNSYYTKNEIDNYELITVDDIDAICGSDITSAANLTF